MACEQGNLECKQVHAEGEQGDAESERGHAESERVHLAGEHARLPLNIVQATPAARGVASKSLKPVSERQAFPHCRAAEPHSFRTFEDF